MSENNTNVPKIRFPGFTGAWEQRKLGEVIESMYNGQTPSRLKGENWDGDINWLSSGELNRGVVTETIEKITSKGQKDANLRVVPAGTFIMAITGLEAAGTRGNCARLAIDTTLNQSCMALFPKKDLLDSNFLFQWYRKVGEEYGICYTQGTKQQSYNSELIKILPISLPKIEEQQKIAAYFNGFDHLITLHQRKLNHLQDEKKSLLQKMFPKKGEDVPEIRFPEFTHAWEQRKLGDLVTQIIREVPKPDKPYTRISVRSHAKGTFHQQVDNPDKVAMNKLFVVKEDDLIVNITFAWEHAIAVANKSDDGLLVSHRFPTYRADGKSDIKFLHYLVSKGSFRRKLEFISPGGAGRNRVMNKKDFLKISESVPTSIEEQKKIGAFFANLDHLINLHQRELDHCKNLKKGLLQQMFV